MRVHVCAHTRGVHVRAGVEVDLVVVRLARALLGRHVEWCALDRREHGGAVRHGAGEAEVAEHDTRAGAKQHVLRLHVAVDDATGMEDIQGFSQGLKVRNDLLGRQSLALDIQR